MREGRHVPGLLPEPPIPEAIRVLSPSHYAGFLACSLREVWAANRVPPALPLTPATRFGSVIHTLLEAAGRGEFVPMSQEAVESRWLELVAGMEAFMKGNWLERHFVPLERSVLQYEVRHIEAVKKAVDLSQEQTVTRSLPPARHHRDVVGFEVTVATPDHKAAGRIDAIMPGRTGVTLRDYKSGAVFDAPDGVLNEAIAFQMKLYAAMYAAMTGTWPAKLEVVPLRGLPQAVPFVADECKELLARALALIDGINSLIGSAKKPDVIINHLANPSPNACSRCFYRPACRPYLEAVEAAPESTGWPADAWGRLREIVKLGNGRLMMTIETNSGAIHIRGITPDVARHPALACVETGHWVAVFGTSKSSGPTTTAVEAASTVIYTNQPRNMPRSYTW